MNSKSHWNTVYDTKEDCELGWHESDPKMTLQLIEKTNLPKEATILNVGAGTTTLIDALLDEGYNNILASDISEIALEKLRKRIAETYEYDLQCIVDDLTNPSQLAELSGIDLWIDRAVLHFFLMEKEQAAYFDLIKKIVRPNGYVLIAVFSLDGAEKCSGLPLYRYNTEMLSDRLGKDFSLIESFDHTYINPFGGERPYVYTLFQKNQ